MVAPLIAAAGRAVAGGARSMGGKMMHSSSAATRSSGSKMLKFSNAKMEKGLEKIAKQSQLSLKFIGKMSKSVAKILGTLAKASPALKQQLIIMGKGISVFLRPIGDIMAKFLRPMAVWVMKVAQKWYALFGTGSGEKESKSYVEDEIKQLKVDKAAAEQRGDIEGAAKIQSDIEAKEAQLKPSRFGDGEAKTMPEFMEAVGQIPNQIAEAWPAFIEGIKEKWGAFKTWISENIGPIWDSVTEKWGAFKTWISEKLEPIWDSVIENWATFKTWIDDTFSTGWTDLKSTLSDFGTWIKDTFSKGWTDFKSSLSDFNTWIKDTFSNIWDTLLQKMKSMWSGVKKLIDKIQFWKRKDDEDDEISNSAVGGAIRETGLYNLHAGERVMTAGDVSRTDNSSSNTSFNTTINIQASVNNDFDIQDLAAKLAELQEVQLRRRVSYM